MLLRNYAVDTTAKAYSNKHFQLNLCKIMSSVYNLLFSTVITLSKIKINIK